MGEGIKQVNNPANGGVGVSYSNVMLGGVNSIAGVADPKTAPSTY